MNEIPVERSEGTTESEKHLARLAERSFLNLWSYPNLYTDRGRTGDGDGKELCDLLVVCGDHILIFSDKTCEWPSDQPVNVAWPRWYGRAVKKSVRQIIGAARWIEQFPDRIFLDRKCQKPFPLEFPPPDRRRVHGIAVANGAGDACKKFFDEGIGSLMLMTGVGVQDNGTPESPFTIGDANPSGSYVHVLDDATLDIVMAELDTISDLTSYLKKKEILLRADQFTVAAAGEEELVAHYMTRMNDQNEHDFIFPPGHTGYAFDQGAFAEMKTNSQYVAKKDADKISYMWDALITNFTEHILAGTSISPDGGTLALSDHERGVRVMALEPRFHRRNLSEGIKGVLEDLSDSPRKVRAMLPNTGAPGKNSGFFFMTLAIPDFLEQDYERYRSGRRAFLEAYLLALLRENPEMSEIVGVAMEPIGPGGSSEDLLYTVQPEWSSKMLADLEEAKKRMEIMQKGNFSTYPVHGDEYPDPE
ncbi:MAG: hypothetical protein HOB82_09080 [Alphaproteobacteria bacterium]|nr:hypothetical protein [Alphaproteobacteria bacterium]